MTPIKLKIYISPYPKAIVTHLWTSTHFNVPKPKVVNRSTIAIVPSGDYSVSNSFLLAFNLR